MPPKLSQSSEAVDQVSRPLDRISLSADIAERCCERLESFINRCNGEHSGEQDTLKSVANGYFAELDRLSVALDRIEKLAVGIGEIG